MTVVLGVCFQIPTVLTHQGRLEFQTLWFLSRERLQLVNGILPMELSALLLPVIFKLRLLLSLVGFSEFADLIDCLHALLLRLLRQLNQLLDF